MPSREWPIAFDGAGITFPTMSSGGFLAGLRNLFDAYVSAVDAWQVYDNGELSGPRLLASRASGAAVEISDPAGWKRLEEIR